MTTISKGELRPRSGRVGEVRNEIKMKYREAMVIATTNNAITYYYHLYIDLLI